MKIFKSVTLAIMALCASLTTPAHAGDEWGTVGNWRIFQDFTAGTCRSIALYDKDMLSFEIDSNDDYMKFRIGNEHWNSLKDEQKISLNILFLNNVTGSLDTGWSDISAIVRVPETYEIITMSLERHVFVRDVAKNHLIGVKYGSVLIGSYNLEGSAAMLTKLNQCASEIARSSVRDPFSG